MAKNRTLFLISSFVAGFSLMTVELTASRVIAPYVGSSLYTWTSVIGVVLLGLSAGYYLGGFLADKYVYKNLNWLVFALASVSVFIIPFIIPFGEILTTWSLTLPVTILLMSFLFFFLPSIFLGALSPVILKNYTNSFECLGISAGTLSAFWSLGSIAGTFITGFIFIGYLGSRATLMGVALLLMCVTLFFYKSKIQLIISILFAIVILIVLFLSVSSVSLAQNTLYSKESNYYSIKVADGVLGMDDVRVLFLDFDAHSIESRSGKFLGGYPDMYPLFSAFKNPLKEIFVIGGGSYSMPKYFADYYKDSKVTVVEIDSKVKEAAEKFFNLKDYRITTERNDGRVALKGKDKKYDLIFEDAFNSFISLPWHLTTKDFAFLAKTRLTEDGIYAVNFVSPTKGKESLFFRSMLKTFREAFPNMYIFTTGELSYYPQNVVLIGINSNFHQDISKIKSNLINLKNGQWLASHIADERNYSDDGGVVLSDNFSPVERLMMPVMNRYFKLYSDFYHSFLKLNS
ncbi:MAG: fused MFS/spermidine synthase [Candidatus Wolfebacteria bacterium]|nr:fused MFS/spermidine synthase [Candidatus Wolfebacteria bacterium]